MSQADFDTAATDAGTQAYNNLFNIFSSQRLDQIEERVGEAAYLGAAVFKVNGAADGQDREYMRWGLLHRYRTELMTAPVHHDNRFVISANEAFMAQAAELYKVQCPVC